jgi:hypothetical protein
MLDERYAKHDSRDFFVERFFLGRSCFLFNNPLDTLNDMGVNAKHFSFAEEFCSPEKHGTVFIGFCSCTVLLFLAGSK